MKRTFLLPLILLLAASGAGAQKLPSRPDSPKKPLSAREIAKDIRPSVVVLMTEDSNGKLSTLGSGFFVRENTLVTNYHVIEGASRVFAKLVGQQARYEVSGTIGTDKTADLALLKIDGIRARPVPLGNSTEAEIGDSVYVIGNPEGLEGTLSQGIISGLRPGYIQITAPISHGSSGGPVLNEEGQVIGIAVGAFEEGQNLNFAIPSSKLTSLMENVTSLKPFPVEKRGVASSDPVSGEWVGTWTIYAVWDPQFEEYSESIHSSLKNPNPFSINLQLNSQKVTGTYRAQDTRFVTPITGSWSDELLVLRYRTESRDDETSSTISRLTLRIADDRMSGEGIAVATEDNRGRLKFKIDAVRRRLDKD